MDVTALAIPDIKLLTPKRHGDHRGFFTETYSRRSFTAHGLAMEFVQDNQSFSRQRGVIRGLHFQAPPKAQDKIVRVVRGAVFDVAVDIRRGSPTYGRHVSALLDDRNGSELFVPKGFAHGLCVLEPDTAVIYKVSDGYAPELEHCLLWNDPALGIDWPVSEADAILTDRDRRGTRLADLATYFD